MNPTETNLEAQISGDKEPKTLLTVRNMVIGCNILLLAAGVVTTFVYRDMIFGGKDLPSKVTASANSKPAQTAPQPQLAIQPSKNKNVPAVKPASTTTVVSPAVNSTTGSSTTKPDKNDTNSDLTVVTDNNSSKVVDITNNEHDNKIESAGTDSNPPMVNDEPPKVSLKANFDAIQAKERALRVYIANLNFEYRNSTSEGEEVNCFQTLQDFSNRLKEYQRTNNTNGFDQDDLEKFESAMAKASEYVKSHSVTNSDGANSAAPSNRSKWGSNVVGFNDLNRKSK